MCSLLMCCVHMYVIDRERLFVFYPFIRNSDCNIEFLISKFLERVYGFLKMSAASSPQRQSEAVPTTRDVAGFEWVDVAASATTPTPEGENLLPPPRRPAVQASNQELGGGINTYWCEVVSMCVRYFGLVCYMCVNAGAWEAAVRIPAQAESEGTTQSMEDKMVSVFCGLLQVFSDAAMPIVRSINLFIPMHITIHKVMHYEAC